MTNVSETLRSPEHSNHQESVEAPGKAEVLRWLSKNRQSIENLLRSARGDVRLQMSERAAQASGLAHQYVMITQNEPHEVRTANGQRVLATFKELDENKSMQLHAADVA